MLLSNCEIQIFKTEAFDSKIADYRTSFLPKIGDLIFGISDYDTKTYRVIKRRWILSKSDSEDSDVSHYIHVLQIYVGLDECDNN